MRYLLHFLGPCQNRRKMATVANYGITRYRKALGNDAVRTARDHCLLDISTPIIHANTALTWHDVTRACRKVRNSKIHALPLATPPCIQWQRNNLPTNLLIPIPIAR